MRFLLPILLVFTTLMPFMALAQTPVVTSTENFEKARVVQITKTYTETQNGLQKATPAQTINAEIIDGTDAGKQVTFDNDYTQLKDGDTFFIRHTVNEIDGVDFWSVADPYRLDTLLLLLLIFLILTAVFGRWQGVRGLISLVGSIGLIFYVLIPGIVHGFSPIILSICIASLIIIFGSYVTHGFNRTTTAAVFGMIATVVITGALSYYFVHATHISGFTSEENVYLNFDTKGSIDMIGLLFGGIMIGLLGVLYDIAIGQAIAIEELLSANNTLSRKEIYSRGLRIGREHIGALINTLAIAYVGASLPLLLLLQSSTAPLPFMINSELFITELMRILLGSIGLILGVPITTAIAAYMLHGKSLTKHAHSHHH